MIYFYQFFIGVIVGGFVYGLPAYLLGFLIGKLTKKD